MIKKPYLHSIHSSPVTCLKAFDNCPKDILSVFESASEANANAATNNTYVSTMVSFNSLSLKFHCLLCVSIH